MPKNKGKGGKTRRRGKKHDDDEKRELSYKEEGQEYALVLRMLGAGRLEAYCYDGKTRQCTIRGNMRRKIWVNQGDTILIGLRDFQDDKADVIQKYSQDEALQLKKVGEIPDNVAATAAGPDQMFEGDDDVGFDFDDI